MPFERLETERLLLRPLTVGDLDGLHVVFSDAEAMRFIPGGACDRDRSRIRLRSLIEHQRVHGFSKWAVIEKESGQLIGDCGFQYLEGGPDIELGFHIARSRWGRGFATEAARACLDWALAERPESVVAIVDDSNQASVRVLEKIGMGPRGRVSHFGREWRLYVTGCEGSGRATPQPRRTAGS
jgi:RimJ/RimL family protein N-acetyltransferase